jgi:hypothetical protein
VFELIIVVFIIDRFLASSCIFVKEDVKQIHTPGYLNLTEADTQKHISSALQMSEVFTAIKFQVLVFWILRSCFVTLRYRRFKGLYYPSASLHDVKLHHEDGGNLFLRNTGILPHHYAVSQPRRPRPKLFR